MVAPSPARPLANSGLTPTRPRPRAQLRFPLDVGSSSTKLRSTVAHTPRLPLCADAEETHRGCHYREGQLCHWAPPPREGRVASLSQALRRQNDALQRARHEMEV